ncbi:MAG: SMC family ATPase, partial [Candidatus Nanoarchaeia archaeon]
MLLKSLKLENIRSFVKEQVSFPIGVTLLAGDIGSGKSTLLHSLEFALFGLKRGELSGSSLLRNGKESGSVEINLNINGKEVMIKRSLKKSTTGISQDFGFLSVDGTGKDYTTLELKQRVLELLGYPQESLTKKSMMFRYTVYAPQEEMKSILLGSEEDRLDTLRQVFNVDKYKRVRENAKIIVAWLREQRKEAAGKIFDLEEKKTSLIEKQSKVKVVEDKLKVIDEQVFIFKKVTEEKKKDLESFEIELQQVQVMKRELLTKEGSLKEKSTLLERTLREINRLVEEIKGLSIDEKSEIKSYVLEIKRYTEMILTVEQNVKELSLHSQEIKTKKKAREELKNKVSQLTTCPTCLQGVNDGHKDEIIKKADEEINQFNTALTEVLAKESDVFFSLDKLKKECESLRNAEKDAAVLKVKFEEVEKKKNVFASMKIEEENLKKEVESYQNSVLILKQEIEKFKDLEIKYQQARLEFEQTRKVEQQAELESAVLKREINLEKTAIETITVEIQKKELIKNKLTEYSRLQDWIADSFIPVCEQMETAVMQRVKADFTALFRKWFILLVDDVGVSVSLSSTLAPVIEQNGFLVEYENLSGGEKTAAALAYRLALNQVVNELTGMHSRELIVLDEPTDGFSTT